jgi:hypothetical protein
MLASISPKGTITPAARQVGPSQRAMPRCDWLRFSKNRESRTGLPAADGLGFPVDIALLQRGQIARVGVRGCRLDRQVIAIASEFLRMVHTTVACSREAERAGTAVGAETAEGSGSPLRRMAHGSRGRSTLAGVQSAILPNLQLTRL